MKFISKGKYISILTALMFVAFVLPANNRIHYIRHFDYSKPTSDQYHYVPLPKKTQRVSSTKGEINLTFYDDMPDSIKTAVIVAKELWETKLHNKKTIYLDVTFEPLEEGTVMSTETGYLNENSNCYPSALASQWREYRDPDTEGPDGYIGLNSDMDWNCSFSNGNNTSYNVTTMALRGIARCLGFVSSIKQLKDSYYFYDGIPTVFDCHLYNGSSCLANMTQYSPTLSEFVTSDNVHFTTGLKNYQIFAPKQYQDGESLCYFKNTNSLMAFSLGEGNAFMNIDSSTIDILNAIGWNLPFETLRIKCSDIDDSGIGSCYKSHSFSLQEHSINISTYLWTFSLKNKQGKYEVISQGRNADFTISKIEKPDRYAFNSNGDLEGKVECVYFVDGKEYYAEPFHVSLEQKPLIVSVYDLTRKWDDYNFDLNFNVCYTGAENILIRIEKQYDFGMITFRVEEPFIAHVNTGQISGLYYSWVTIVASNEYGTTQKTLEFPPFFDEEQPISTPASVSPLHDKNDDFEIQVYNLQGDLMYYGHAADFDEGSLTKGLYIKRTLFQSGEYSTSKIAIQ